MESKNIVIIGAGLAGIACASKLLENEIDDFVILEAEDRIGGRIHSVNFGKANQRIDLGGQVGYYFYSIIDY
jgi:monoamine oxidase